MVIAGNVFLSVNASALVLGVQQTYMEEGKTNWSWTACAKAVMEYFEAQATQTEIGNYGTNGADVPNVLFGNSDINRHGVDEILLKFANLHSWGSSSPIEPEYTVELINHFRSPVLIRWNRDSSVETSPIESGGRVVVIKGARYAAGKLYLVLMDPVDGTYEKDYDWIVRGNGHIWTETLEIITRPPFGYKLPADKDVTDKIGPISSKIDVPAILENPDWDGIRAQK